MAKECNTQQQMKRKMKEIRIEHKVIWLSIVTVTKMQLRQIADHKCSDLPNCIHVQGFR